MVFVPGLIFQCQFLYVASVVILAVFIILEMARVIKLYPVAEILESSVKAFIDEKDAGQVTFTPIYLLVGCSLPLWIHNSPCDLAGSTSFEFLPLISGILSIGIGDTFASVVGSTVGRHKWPKSNKSVEGTIASIIAQAAFIYALNTLGFVPLNTRLTALCGIAVIINSLVEALTDQVDNLVLPIVTYVILTIK
jgi:dolichol kinase